MAQEEKKKKLNIDLPEELASGTYSNLTWYHPAQAGSETKVSAAENHPEYTGRTTEFTGRGAVLGTLLG